MSRYAIAILAVPLIVAPASALPPTNAETLEHATDVLNELTKIPLKGIPTKLLADAEGVAIIPRVIKAGFIFGGRGGHGVVFAKDKDGLWGEPVFINLGGASVGFQAGVESTDVVLVFRDRKSLDRLLEGKGKVTLGADAAVAAGPIGRMAAAATDAKMKAEILSYSRSRGLFAGVSLDGAAIHADLKSNTAFRQPGREMEQKLAAKLRSTLTELSKENRIPLEPNLNPPVAPAKP